MNTITPSSGITKKFFQNYRSNLLSFRYDLRNCTAIKEELNGVIGTGRVNGCADERLGIFTDVVSV